MEGCDYSFTRPDVWCLANNGYRFAGRYFGAGTSDKRATAAECNLLAQAGIDVFAICEGWEDDALRGYDKGAYHARLAADELAACGGPGDAPIYFAVDVQVSRSDMDQVAYYFDGVQAVIGAARTGIYGSFTAVEYAAQYGTATWFWQTYAWSGDQWSAHNHIEQYANRIDTCGGLIDRCRSKRKSFGQWRPGGAVAPPGEDTPDPSVSESDWDLTYHFTYLADATGYLAMVGNQVAGAIEALAR